MVTGLTKLSPRGLGTMPGRQLGSLSGYDKNFATG